VSGTSELGRSITEATSRIHEIIDAAERLAEEIRAEAEAEAARYLEERRREADRLTEDRRAELGKLTDSAAEQAERLGAEAESLSQTIEAIRWVAEKRPVAQPGRPSNEPEREPAREEPLLRATQLAVEGAPREEIVDVMRREFGLTEPEVVVDQVLGPTGDRMRGD
jgi:cell division septum initiation protein DivIVA